jgi:hypothetical protein
MTEEILTTDDEPIVALAAETMQGDLCTALVDELKAARDVWPKLSQHDQDHIIHRFDKRVGTAIREAVRMIASDKRPTIMAKLDQITAKDGIKAVLVVASTDPQRHELLDSVGKVVLLVVADAEPYSGGEAPKSEPEQKSLEVTIELSEKATAAAEIAINGPTSDPDQEAEAEDADAWQRDNDALYDTLLLLPEAVTGFDNDDEANLARVQSWTDEEAQEIERYAAAALDPNVPDEAVPPIPVLLQQRPLPL